MAVIVNYIDLVPLSEAKLYLRIDSDITETDAEIGLMINSACELIEDFTQHYLKPQSKTFYFDSNDSVRIYAYPISAITAPATATDYSVTVKQLYSIYAGNVSTLESVTASIGYADTNNVKSIFKMAVLETIRLWFYGSESEEVVKGFLPKSVSGMVNQQRRFLI